MGHIPRVYVPGRLAPGPLALGGDVASRLGTVLRVRPGDELRLFAGEGREWRGVVGTAERGRVVVEVVEVARQEPPPEPVVEAWLPVIRPQRLEWAVEKCTEAGADVIRLAAMEFGQRGTEPSAARLERLERIAAEASEQCGRLYLPVIERGGSLERLLEGFAGAVTALDREGMGPGELVPLLPARGRLAVVCGPEGGFSPRELDLLRRRGALFLRAGPHILRAETAAVAGVVLVRALLG